MLTSSFTILTSVYLLTKPTIKRNHNLMVEEDSTELLVLEMEKHTMFSVSNLLVGYTT